MEKSKPKIFLSAAISLDGKLATSTGDSKLSSRTDLIRLHKLRSQVDAILIGRNTVKIDDPLLTVRYFKGKNPLRIILDSKGTIPSKSKILKTCNEVKTIIVVSKQISKKNFTRLKKFPIEIWIIGKTKIDVKLLIKKIEKEKIKTLLIEGGGTINWEFIRSNLIDEFFITITPLIIGGTKSISLVQGKGFDLITKSTHLQLVKSKKLENDIFLHYVKN